MRLIESLKKRKLVLFNIFLTLYVGTNLIGGERGLVSYFEKKQIYRDLLLKEKIYKNSTQFNQVYSFLDNIEKLKNKNKQLLISNTIIESKIHTLELSNCIQKLMNNI